MFLKQCRNLYFCTQRFSHPLLNFSFLTSQNCAFNFIKQTSTAKSSPAGIGDLPCRVKREDVFKSYFHNYLLKNKDKYGLFSAEDMNFEEETKVSLKFLNDFVNNFNETLEEIPEELERSINSEIHNYNGDEICKYILLISKLNCSSKTTLVKYLDTAIHKKGVSTNDALKILCILRTLPGNNLDSKLLWKALYKLYDRVNQLSSEQKVLFFFYLLKLDPISTKKKKYNFILSVIETIPKFNSDELGIIARGFQMTSMIPSDIKFIQAVIKKTVTEKQNFNELSLVVILKMIADKVNFRNENDIHNLQEEFIPLIPTFQNSTVLTLAGIGSSFSFVNSSFWEVLIKHFKENFTTCTSNELIRLVYLTSIFDYYDDELFHKIIQKVEAQTNLSPNSLILLLGSLVLHQVYPEKLLHKVFSKDFRLLLAKDKNLGTISKYTYAFLNCCVELDMPTNNLMLMDETERKRCYKVFLYSNGSKSKSNFWFFATCKAQKILINEHGKNSVFKMTCVPYNDSGLVMRFDKNFKVKEIPQEFKQFDKQCPVEALKDDHFWIFIKIIDEYGFSLMNNKLSLKTKTFIRHLKILGYIPVCIKCKDWSDWYKEGVLTQSLLNTVQKSLQDTVEKS